MSEKNKVVALIDDDDGPILAYHQALKDAKFKVVRIKKFKDAIAFIEKPEPVPDMWVVDVMMPIGDESLVIDGENVMQATNLGIAAGLFIYRKMKKKYPDTPAMMLTSITNPKLLDQIEGSLQGGDTCEAKLDILPSTLVKICKKRLP